MTIPSFNLAKEEKILNMFVRDNQCQLQHDQLHWEGKLMKTLIVCFFAFSLVKFVPRFSYSAGNT